MTEVRWDVRRFATLPSTNDWLLAEARGGAAAGTVAVADHQRCGRGRLGRRWEAPPGSSLLVSVLLRPVAPVGDLYPVTAAVALSAAEACAEVAGVLPAIKWPNDLLVGERKLAGVLAESDPAAPGGREGSVAVVAGLGCNVDWEAPEGATTLRQVTGRVVDREALLAAYLAALGRRTASLDEVTGRRALVDELRQRCATLGRTVRATLGTGQAATERTGVAVAIDDRGCLLIDDGETVAAVAAADVVHLRPHGAPPAPPGHGAPPTLPGHGAPGPR